MNVEKLKALYLKYELTKDDVYKHQHYIIITRSELTRYKQKSKYQFITM